MCLYAVARSIFFTRTILLQASRRLSEEQLATLTSQKAVNEYLESQRENITNAIKQNLAVGDIFKRENLEVDNRII